MSIFKEGRRCPILGRICIREECRGFGVQGICEREVKKYLTRAELINSMTGGNIYKMANVTLNVMSDHEAEESARKLNIGVNIFRNIVMNTISVAQNAGYKRR